MRAALILLAAMLSGCHAARGPLSREPVQPAPVPALPAAPTLDELDTDAGAHRMADLLLACDAVHAQAQALRQSVLSLDAEADALLAALNVERRALDVDQQQARLDIWSWRTTALGTGLLAVACTVRG